MKTASIFIATAAGPAGLSDSWDTRSIGMKGIN
jgi:hypothetical protein